MLAFWRGTPEANFFGFWHEAADWCHAVIGSLSGAKRTCAATLPGSSRALLTHFCHCTINFVVLHNSVFTQRCGNVRLPACGGAHEAPRFHRPSWRRGSHLAARREGAAGDADHRIPRLLIG